MQGEDMGKGGPKKERVGKDAKEPPIKRQIFLLRNQDSDFNGGWILFFSISPTYNIVLTENCLSRHVYFFAITCAMF